MAIMEAWNLFCLTLIAFFVGIVASRLYWRRKLQRHVRERFEDQVQRAVAEELKRSGYLKTEGGAESSARDKREPFG